LKTAARLAVERLCEEPYASIICYPKPTNVELKKRLIELKKLGVKALIFTGAKQVFNTPVLGKGCVGIVTLACRNREKAALKIRRVDADRSRMQREAALLRKANSVSVGPDLLAVSRNFLIMQFIHGSLLPQWLAKCKRTNRIRAVLREVLEQCYRLDKAGLDHGELSHAPKHVIIDEKDEPFIVDFETASLNRRPSNVTSICQFLFISGTVAETIARKLGPGNKEAIIEALRRYKTGRVRENFEAVKKACGF
jgi:putative serine/threonine protein kinase